MLVLFFLTSGYTELYLDISLYYCNCPLVEAIARTGSRLDIARIDLIGIVMEHIGPEPRRWQRARGGAQGAFCSTACPFAELCGDVHAHGDLCD